MIKENDIRNICSNLGWTLILNNGVAEFYKSSPMNDNYGFKIIYHDLIDLLENVNGYVFAFNREDYLADMMKQHREEFTSAIMVDAYLTDAIIIKNMLETLNNELQKLSE